MRKTIVALGLLVAGMASADRGWHRGWERRDARHERGKIECERRRVEQERARIEQERMRIEMERERLRREDEMRNRAAWHHHQGPVAECCRHPRGEKVAPPPAPEKPRGSARIEVVWNSGPIVLK